MAEKEKEEKTNPARGAAGSAHPTPSLVIKETPAIVRKGGPATVGARENPVLASIDERKSEQRMDETGKGGRSERGDKIEVEEIRWGTKTPTVSEMLVWLDTYDDIFSDFDPRPFAQRELSDDFLKELGRRYMKNTKGGVEVHFQIPAAAREPRLEATIRKRLREHFAHELHDVRQQIRQHRQKGLIYAGAGFGLLMADLGITLWQPEAVWAKVAGILLTPAGWFSLWSGMEKLAEVPYKLEHLRSFHDKFAKCNYTFVTHDGE